MIIPGLVSTVVPVRNRPVLLRRAVASALAQVGTSIEVIIVDDGSDDETPTVIAELAQAHPDRIRAVRRDRPGGPGAAREAGRQLVRGEFVQHLDSDDTLTPNKTRVQIEALRRHPEADICYGRDQAEFRRADGSVFALVHVVPLIEHLFPTLFVVRPWYTFNPLYRRAIVDLVGPWRPLWCSEDIEYDSRMAAAGARLCFVDVLTGTLNRSGHRHLSGGEPTRRTLSGWASARESILANARRCGAPLEGPEFDEFVRSMFAVARQCGAVGLPVTSERLFELARSIAVDPLDYGWRAYRAVASRFGWRTAGVLSRVLDRARHWARRSCA